MVGAVQYVGTAVSEARCFEEVGGGGRCFVGWMPVHYCTHLIRDVEVPSDYFRGG